MSFGDGAGRADLDRAARRAVVADVAQRLRDEYVEPDVGTRAADNIERALAAGAYDDLRQAAALADRLTAELFEIAHDRHLKIIAQIGPLPAGSRKVGPQINEFGVVRADQLAGNVGYLEVIGFVRSKNAREPLNRAMAALTHTRALIIDMRRNNGGSTHGVAYLLSFFFDGGTPVRVIDILWRNPGTTEYRTDPRFTCPTPTSYLGKPVSVLTSARTVSGGEAFCHEMQAMKLATLVGETTRGGANAPRPGRSSDVGAGLVMSLPRGMCRSPVTGGNWERVGVAADIAVESETALKVALGQLGETAQATLIDDLSQARLFQPRAAPLPGAEPALRRLIEGMATAQPDYEQMTPAFANAVRSQLAETGVRLNAPGPIQSVIFLGPEMTGDRFEVNFAKGAELQTIFLSPEGKIAASFLPPVEPP